jgi:(E)-4-hydroxy-3-methylbut-2-enyl-diphosphate synthase
MEKKKISDTDYCVSLWKYARFATRAVKIGSTGIGGENPLRLQSMTTTDTMNTEATVQQSIRMIEAGCELVRITAPSIKEAENLRQIRDSLRQLGYSTPLVADIHFTPNAAEVAAGIVEKVRVNPGNYADKKKFETIDYSDNSYALELERIREKFMPLVQLCKENGTAMRIGTNHGSLSDRIMSRYGDTPRGMVESAMEFIRICREMDFHEIVISMKASNPQVMVQAYRLLVHEMMTEGMNYPLHLGVTEAGEGEDGRIKSAVGIGALLEDGLGDTIRVSLTEEPEAEIPVAKILAEHYVGRENHTEIIPTTIPIDPFSYSRRPTRTTLNVGGREVPRVIMDLSLKERITPAMLFPYGYNYSVPLDKWNLSDMACDFIYVGSKPITFAIPGTLGIIEDLDFYTGAERHYPLMSKEQYLTLPTPDTLHFIDVNTSELTGGLIAKLQSDGGAVLVLSSDNRHALASLRAEVFRLMNAQCEVPVIFRRNYETGSTETFQLKASADLGGLLIDGLGDGLWLRADNVPSREVNSTAFGILQATRTRISRTEYISCPSCGRTLFDLQETTARIRKRTDHLKGIKIGIMGCIVNGPGEMADADYGYVGTGPGKITLYKEKEVVKRNVPSDQAVDELIALIKSGGDWVEPPQGD